MVTTAFHCSRLTIYTNDQLKFVGNINFHIANMKFDVTNGDYPIIQGLDLTIHDTKIHAVILIFLLPENFGWSLVNINQPVLGSNTLFWVQVKYLLPFILSKIDLKLSNYNKSLNKLEV